MDEKKKDKIMIPDTQDNAADEIAASEVNETASAPKKSFGRKILIYIKPWLNIKFLMTYGLV